MYYEFFQKNKRRIITISVTLFVIITLWTAIVMIGRIGKTPLTIAAVPSDSTIVVDGNHLGDGTYWLPAGTYELSADKDGFESQKKTVVVTPEKKNNVTAISLTPKSNKAKEWANKHQRDYQNNEQYGAIAARADGQYFTEKNPITKNLPFTDPYFTIGYMLNNDQSIDITVATPSPRYRFYAVEKIREWGYDPTDFTVVFKDFHNPLGEDKK